MGTGSTEMTSSAFTDRSNGYEAISGDYMSIRSPSIGVATVRDWAKILPGGGSVLDMGCGHGMPISKALIDEGLTVYAIDASPSMINAFHARFPNIPAECSAIEDSQLFGRRFDGIIAWGLMFLLARDAQVRLIHQVASVLKPGGRFLFTAPHQVCEWLDNLTGRRSVSLGSDTYHQVIESAGLVLDGEGESEDEGQNHYYLLRKPDERHESSSARATAV